MSAPPSKTLGKRVQLEMFFTLPDFSDIPLRDLQDSMQRPFFSLSKKKRVKAIEYVSPDRTVSVNVSANPQFGMATIWDADILIYLTSHLNELKRRGDNDLSPTIRVMPGDMLKRICWGCDGKAYARLTQALDRLQSTTIKTNIRSSSKTRESTFSWIDSYTHLVDEHTQRSLGMDITLSKWFFDGVMDQKQILAISPLYFEITSATGRFLYRTARKHAGGNGAAGFVISFETLHAKSGSESAFPVFKRKLIEIAQKNALPEVHLEVLDVDRPRPRLKMVLRRHLDEELATPPPSIEVAPPPALRRPQKKAPLAAASQDDGDLVAPELAKQLISRLASQFTALAEEKVPSPLSTPAPIPPGRGRKQDRAIDILEPEHYRAIREECPGWDLDAMMQTFNRFLNANPDELPFNYSKRFYHFMRTHHQRNRHKLKGQ